MLYYHKDKPKQNCVLDKAELTTCSHLVDRIWQDKQDESLKMSFSIQNLKSEDDEIK